MKPIKTTFFSLVILFIGTSLITSCSKEDENNNGMTQNAKVSTFLKSFYSKDFKFGKSKDLKITRQSSSTNTNTGEFARTAEFDDVIVKEVFVDNEERARGYIVNDKDTDEFLYFIDVDRVNYKLTSVDIDANETKVSDNINQLDKYASTNQFDFIKIAQDLINQPGTPPVVQRWRYEWGACGGGFRGLYRAYYILGFQISDSEPALDSNGHQIKEAC